MQVPFPWEWSMYAFPVQESSLQDTCVIIITITQVCPCSTSTSESKRLFSSSLEWKFLCKLWYFCGSLSVKLLATVHFAQHQDASSLSSSATLPYSNMFQMIPILTCPVTGVIFTRRVLTWKTHIIAANPNM